MPHALILDEFSKETERLSQVFRDAGFSIDVFDNVAEARDALLRHIPEVALLNLEIGSDAAGEEALALFDNEIVANVVEVYLLSSKPDHRQAARGMRLGAADYLVRGDGSIDQLRANLDKFIENMAGDQDGDAQAHSSGRGRLVGESPPMLKLYRTLRKVAPTDATIFLVGESGTGKEVTAQTIHELSVRSQEPLVSLNCGAIAPELVESELFGHKKGAFTGATKDHRGYFSRAKGGTLFLDEVTEMAADIQVKLLRVLETRKFRPVGGENDIAADVRVIASTNRDPGEAVEQGVLREDLYYRLAQFPIRIPPLRERGDDIILLAEYFLQNQIVANGIDKSFDSEALDMLRAHDWPGNVRELLNVVTRAYIMAGTTVTADDLPANFPSSAPVSEGQIRISVGQTLAEVERRVTLATLAHFDDDKQQAADTLGISLKTLYNRLKKYRSKA